MFKRILKILGICIATFVVVCGAGVGIYALQGGFKENEINILRLYMDDATKADKTIYTLNDFTTKINFEPLDATNTDLEVVIQDPLRQVDGEGNLIKEGVLKNIPKTIKAGQDFNIEINKDENGNNIGGVVSLTFKPKGNDKAITDFTLKVIVDVAIPNNSLYFAGNNSDTYSTTSGKTITMGISNNEQNIYLKSNLVNAFFLQADNKNLKQANISYVYKNLKGELIEEKSFADLQYDRVYNEETKEYNYFYKVPVTPSQSGTITITAKMHKTHEIEEAYIAGDFDNIQQPSSTNPGAQEKLDKYNDFINKYIEFFDTNEFSYAFFKNYLTNDGRVKLPYSAVENSKEFVFQTCNSTINISAVNLKSISSIDAPQEFQVFSKSTYTLSDMINKFGLDITLDQDNVAQIGKEKSNLFSTLQVSPYIYIEKSEYLVTKDTLWQNYGIVLGVTGFDSNGKPQVSDKVVSIENIESDEWIGFLILLSGKSSYKEYITSDLQNDAENKVWTLGFNVPLLENNTETSISNVSKALFLQFQVTGRDLNTNKTIVRDTYTRIYIGYEEYDYIDEDSAKITFANTLKRMSINKNVQNASSYGYASELNTQKVSVSLKDSINNYDRVQYKDIMYFVEKNSNTVDSGSTNGRSTKLATIGSYKFRYLNPGASGTSANVKLFDSDEDLVGERLLNNGTIKNPNYYLYAINASKDPVRIFAVVYLSDVDGNPLDIDGRPIVIDESQTGVDPTTLVVFAITDITSSGMASVAIDNFVDNVNYYTQSKVGIEITEDQIIDDETVTTTFTINEGSFVKRNKIDEFEGFSESKLEELQSLLKLKLLYRNRLTLYATNFEWDETGKPMTGDVTSDTLLLNVKDFNGNIIKDKAYTINTYQNKQLALNDMAKDFKDNFYLNVQSTNLSPVQDIQIVYEDPSDINSQIIGIKFEIVVDGKSVSDDDYIYIKPNDGVPNALSNSNDYVSWEVNRLEVQDVKLDNGLNTNQKLYAIYSDKTASSSSKILDFGEVSYTNNDSLDFEKYYIYKFGSSVLKGSTEDNVEFEIVTNLYDSDSSNPNINLIDISQYAYEDANSNIETDTNKDLFKDISAYINYYTTNTNTMEITYKNPKGVAQLQQDLYFPSEGNYICIGSKKYAIKNGNITIDGVLYPKYITAGGRNYPVTTSTKEGYFQNEDVVIIKAGEYFPIIDFKDNGKSVVIICDEEFTILKNDLGTDADGIIYNIADQSTGRHRSVKINESAKVNGVAYSPSAFIDDGSSDNTKTALEKEETQVTIDGKNLTYVDSATVKFKKGGTLKDDNGEEIFVKDPNGKYYLNGGVFEICPENTSADLRYSKKGITAYLMISYYFTGLNGENSKPITKVIAYELNQEPVTLVATGAPQDEGKNGFVIGNQEDYTSNRINLNAGTQTEFSLGNVNNSSVKSNDYSINIFGATYDKYIFTHCTFNIGSGSSAGISFMKNGQPTDTLKISSLDDKIVVSVPDKYAEDNATIIISYTDETGTIISKYLGLKIKPNYSFAVISSDVSIDGDNHIYSISLDQGQTHSLNTTLSKYFEWSNNLVLEAIDENQKYIQISGDNLTIGKSYATVSSDGRIQRDYVDFAMKLVGGNEVGINYRLRIYINPKYTLDFNGLTNTNVIYGQSIFSSDYIKIYEGLSKETEVSTANYQTILNEIGLTLYRNDINASNICDGGKVTSDDSDDKYTTQTGVKFVIAYNEAIESLGYTQVSHNVALNVVGFEKYFSQAGELGFTEDRVSTYPTTEEDLNAYQSTYEFPNREIQFVLKDSDTLNMDNHFAVFIIGNSIKTNIYALLTDGTNPYHDLTNVFGSFNLAFATLEGGDYKVLAIDTTVSVTISKLEMFYNTTGFTASDTYDTLKDNNAVKLINDFEITKNSGESVEVDKYVRIFVDGVKKVVLFVDGENSYSTITVGTETKTYNIVYKMNESESEVIDTGIKVTIKVESV